MTGPDENDVILWKSLMIAGALTLAFYIFVLVYTQNY